MVASSGRPRGRSGSCSLIAVEFESCTSASKRSIGAGDKPRIAAEAAKLPIVHNLNGLAVVGPPLGPAEYVSCKCKCKCKQFTSHIYVGH